MSKIRFAIAYPVWCQYDDGFREPEGDMAFEPPPKVGDELILCDKKTWIIVKIEQGYNWPKVICERKQNIN